MFQFMKIFSNSVLTLTRIARFCAALLLLAVAGLPARADVRLPGIISSNMVLQQRTRVPVWGWADEGEEVTVQFRNQKLKTRAEGGRWTVYLTDLKAGGPETLVVTGKNSISLNNVMVGEVWVASGQSNMEWQLRRAFEPDQDIAGSGDPQLRLFTVPRLKSDEPVADVKASWLESTPESTPAFSAVAYYFARDLRNALGVPVGIIQTAWGGSPAEVWIQKSKLESNPDYRKSILEPFPAAWAKYEQALADYERQAAELKKQGQKPSGQPPRIPWKPSELYNGMIVPVVPYAIKGAIWYQGESNAPRAFQYRSLFADMIRNWRQEWGQGDFPFLAVQLAPYRKIQPQPGESDWAELREAQNIAVRALPNAAAVVITDVGEQDDIHPTKKQPVGARLALAARGIAYRQKISYSGPVYKEMKLNGGKAILTFDHADGGLVARNGDLKGFVVSGPDRRFVWAKAEIDGNKVTVWSPEVPNPVAVRFGWADYPVVNLWNGAGLPASPFRTDDFPMIKTPKE